MTKKHKYEYDKDKDKPTTNKSEQLRKKEHIFIYYTVPHLST